VRRGRQAFVVCPLVAESQALQTKAATQEYEVLSREVFPELKLGLLHGRIPSPEKDRVLQAFRDGEFDILVATTVIEVGIDIPNATVMLIEGSDRFGLAQLHQLRGRVGRSHHRAYAYLIIPPRSALTPDALKRLDVIESLEDLGAGFMLAQHDLEIRGAGELLGEEQSGQIQELGFSLEEIAELLRLNDGVHCRDVRGLAAKKLALVEARIRDLTLVRRTLKQLIAECDAGNAREHCPIIDSLSAAGRRRN